MSYEVIAKLEYSKLVGKIECRESETSLLACFSVLLNLSGIKVRLTHLLGLAPMPHGQTTGRFFQVLSRRLGMQTMGIAQEEIAATVASWPVLVMNASGYCFLLLKLEQDYFVAALPGYSEQVCNLSFEDELMQSACTAYAIRMHHLGPAIPKGERHPKLYLLPCLTCYQGRYDRNAFLAYDAQTALLPKAIFHAPLPLTALSASALFASHVSICPNRPQYYGQYRSFNLKRGDTVFVQHTELSPAVDTLLAIASEHQPAGIQEAVKFSARLFSDFLAIHPFVNANQRMAMLIVSKYLSLWKFKIHWQQITSTQFYYWMRLATRGHIRLLENGFRENIEPI
ncbi:hypothetical protein UNDKW_3951 [Undibacterium sp. KW1]|uniref:Fic family protein n=1 Tax=Undibacterium sp. KW1 TaxID=2058624 RepID=UPI001331D165|nr:Fic family protein [Undibacterium sp. KW1]BBB62224.1 hypothetical protein UNDKW_3951 [Undibacterium sp. KW1]